jgi:hypothetical protein
MYSFTKQTRDKFLEKVGLDLTYFYDELCSHKEQEAIVALAEIEYARGHNDGTAVSQDDIDTLMEEQYNRGYDDAMDDYVESRDDAYNEGYGQALQEAQDAILHIGRNK